MSLYIELYINNRYIGDATVSNVSNLSDISDYVVSARTNPFPNKTDPKIKNTFKVEGHNRNQTAWALVAKVAERLAQEQNSD